LVGTIDVQILPAVIYIISMTSMVCNINIMSAISSPPSLCHLQ